MPIIFQFCLFDCWSSSLQPFLSLRPPQDTFGSNFGIALSLVDTIIYGRTYLFKNAVAGVVMSVFLCLVGGWWMGWLIVGWWRSVSTVLLMSCFRECECGRDTYARCCGLLVDAECVFCLSLQFTML